MSLADATSPATFEWITPACAEGRLRHRLDTRTLSEGHPYQVNIYDENWTDAGQVRFAPHNPLAGEQKSLSKGVYVTGGWADSSLYDAFSYIEEGGYVPNWVQGIAVDVAWRQLQPSGPWDLDTSRIKRVLDYAELHAAPDRVSPLPVIVVIEVGDNATPLWFVRDSADGFGRRVVRYEDGDGLAFGFTPWDTVAGDMFNNLTARVAAEFDEAPGLGGVYVGGAGTPRYPEMWYSRFTGCDGRYVGDRNGDGYLNGPDFDWTTPCPSLGPDPMRQAAAWKDAYTVMSSQFPRTPLIGMLDVTRESDDYGDLRRTTAAMASILEDPDVAGDRHLAIGVTNMSPHTFDRQDVASFSRNDWKKYPVINSYAERYPDVFRLNEVDPVRFSNLSNSPDSGAYMPSGRTAPAQAGEEGGKDYRRWLENVVGYCGDAKEPNDGDNPFTVTCDAVLVHRSNLDPGFYVHEWVFDTCTLREASRLTFGTADAGGDCSDPAPALAPWR
ncbi:hypothetical protein Psi02_11670 [Planotetraspora silvatica]|uniref:Uncharacterized protein n=2 Tax=Planotetraspora silvatica TaxID=234614 RepID=A0A8J3UFQ6_9ACTN|nr:hypothetical protein Psi02_11670 [Planotetraspora silvatica]